MKLLSDKNFLDAIHSYERQLAKLLAVLLAIVVGVASIELLIQSGWKIIQLQTDWFDGSMIKLLDRLLLVFIALEVLQNVTAYLKDQAIQQLDHAAVKPISLQLDNLPATLYYELY